MSPSAPSKFRHHLSQFAPVIGGAVSFGCSDVFTKVALIEGAGVLGMYHVYSQNHEEVPGS